MTPRREPPGSLVVAGRRPVLEALEAGAVIEVLVDDATRARGGLEPILSAARSRDVRVRPIARGSLEAMAPDVPHQGVAARIGAPPELAEADLGDRRWGPDDVVVALDGVTDPRNVGAVARTAEAAGAAALVLRRRRGAGVTTVALKSSAGALLHLPVARVANVPRALGRLRSAGFWVVGLDERAEVEIGGSERPPGRLAVVLGSEGAGLSRLVRASCDELLSIPMRGRVSSLNVAVAAGVALFAYALRPTTP
ncbi:MAG TPA: 23S rRNA (guanosine(2251)-2'-O)-methyltransferase RlmB [Actinomycetota bacterium]|nr:23S rRNA (guanosine(2251)-2'-O)-methyltransferase RlmB [Actinomycetota bacterium]